MYYVYIIISTASKLKYVGFTSNLKRRVREHQDGKSEFTGKHKGWQLVYYEGFASKTDALREEKFLKSGKGKSRIKYLLQNTI